MNAQTKIDVKKIMCTVSLFFAFFLLLAGLQYISLPYAEDGLKQSARTVLENWSDKAPEIGDKIQAAPLGWNYSQTYFSLLRGRVNGFVYIIRITGNAGPYTGIFYYTPQTGTVFCGLAGISGKAKGADHYGITSRIITEWVHKLDAIAKKTGGLK